MLGVRLDNLNRSELKAQFKEILQGNKFCQLATVNPEFLVYAHKYPKFKNLLNKTTLNICDGAGMSWMELLLYGKKLHRIPGVSVAELLCEVCAEEKKSIFFFGGFNVAEKAAQKMLKKYPNLKIVGTWDGDEHTFDEINTTKPEAILVAMGSPKQENWLSEKAPKINSLRIGIGVGGTFDFWSGNVRRAPLWMQKIGLEWLFRLITQPQRWKRIMQAVIVFPILMIKNRFSNKS